MHWNLDTLKFHAVKTASFYTCFAMQENKPQISNSVAV